MRALSARQASRCETAQTPACHCRCGGRLHGSMRNLIEEGREANPNFYEQLPGDDPHHVRSKAEKKQRAREARSREKARGQGRLWADFQKWEENL